MRKMRLRPYRRTNDDDDSKEGTQFLWSIDTRANSRYRFSVSLFQWQRSELHLWKWTADSFLFSAEWTAPTLCHVPCTRSILKSCSILCVPSSSSTAYSLSSLSLLFSLAPSHSLQLLRPTVLTHSHFSWIKRAQQRSRESLFAVDAIGLPPIQSKWFGPRIKISFFRLCGPFFVGSAFCILHVALYRSNCNEMRKCNAVQDPMIKWNYSHLTRFQWENEIASNNCSCSTTKNNIHCSSSFWNGNSSCSEHFRWIPRTFR